MPGRREVERDIRKAAQSCVSYSAALDPLRVYLCLDGDLLPFDRASAREAAKLAADIRSGIAEAAISALYPSQPKQKRASARKGTRRCSDS
jgi:hypothetical protein